MAKGEAVSVETLGHRKSGVPPLPLLELAETELRSTMLDDEKLLASKTLASKT